MNTNDLTVMVNGMPGKMALETARVCLDRGIKLARIGFTGKGQQSAFTVDGASSSLEVNLIEGPGFLPNDQIKSILTDMKKSSKRFVIVDYTHPSAIANNIQAYVDADCDFVMGTTGGDPKVMKEIFDEGSNLAVIAPNMAKQIVALQLGLQEMATRFPQSFSGYKLTVTESHQSSKADTSGTAKALVSYFKDLTGAPFDNDEIAMLREKQLQIDFGVPESAIGGHAFHTYTLTNLDNSVSFELKHNVCGRRIYAEGTVDAVEFVCSQRDKLAASSGTKRLYNMIDVLESGSMK